MPENFILCTVYIRSLMLFLRAGVEKKNQDTLSHIRDIKYIFSVLVTYPREQ